MPTAYLHAGQFKTGTSAIQASLLARRAHFAAHGLLVPQAGQSPETGAHHALAQALAGLPLGPKQATIPQRLQAEIEAAGRPDVLISSEFLSLILRPRGALEQVSGWFAAIGYDVAIVLFMRNIPDFVNSAYAQSTRLLAQHRGIDAYVDDWIRRHTVRPVWAVLEAATAVRAIIRPYGAAAREAGALGALMQAIGRQEAAEGLANETTGLENVRQGPFGVHVRRFTRRLVEAGGHDLPRGMRRRLSERIDAILAGRPAEAAPYLGLTPDRLARLEAATGSEIDALSRRLWGAPAAETLPLPAGIGESNDPEDTGVLPDDWPAAMAKVRSAWRPMARRLANRTPADRPRGMAGRLQRAGYDVREIGFDPGGDEVI